MTLLDRLLDPFRGKAITIPPHDGAWKPNTALDEARLVAEGSASHTAADWVPALMRKTSDGAVWRVDLRAGRAERIAGQLAFPAGLAIGADGGLVVAEAFAHRLVAIPAKGRGKTVLDRIPGYPGRIAAAHDGGWWLAVFAPRNRLIELVLHEDRYRADMIATIPQDHWIAPALRSGATFLEPLQRGAVRTMGQLKPWAPSRSYGLVARLDRGFLPLESLHSRSDGLRHGATAVLDHEARCLVALKGAG